MEKIILEKARSRNQIEIFPKDEDDDWFIYVNTVDKKSRKISYSSLIILKDLPNHLRYLKGLGWEEMKGS